jgi:hypothetical protein
VPRISLRNGGRGDQAQQQQPAQALLVDFVDDGDRRLGGVGLIGQADEPRDPQADRRPTVVAHRPDRDVILLVDVAQVVELLGGQLGLGREEPGVARGGRQPVEAGAEQLLVLGPEQPDQHLGAVAEHRVLEVVAREEPGLGHGDQEIDRE